MRLIALLPILVLASGGCAEVVQGPRVVASESDVFYIRYLPWRNSKSGVFTMADGVCAGSGRTAVPIRRDQWAALDLRYYTFRCEALAVATPRPTDPPLDEPPPPSATPSLPRPDAPAT